MSAGLSALILDLDGVVADTERASFAAVAETYANIAVRLDEEELNGLVGLEFQRLEPLLRARHPVNADPRRLRDDHDRRYIAKLRQGIDPNPGLVDLLDAVRAAGVPIGIASSSPLHQVELVLEATGIRSLVDIVAAGTEVDRTKPAPDVYLLALNRLRVDSAHAVAIEDSAPGIAAAVAAGLTCVALRTATTAAHDLRGTAAVVNSLREVTLDRLNALVLDAKAGDQKP